VWVDRLRAQRDAHPDRIAVEAHDRTWTYAELFAAADVLAAALRRIGVGAGDRVLISAPISAGAAVSMLGVLLADAVMVPVPEHLAPLAVQERRQVADVRAAIAVGPHPSTVAADIAVSLDGTSIEVLAADVTGATEMPGTPAVDSSHDAPAYVFFTSGTTGRVRGVLGVRSSVVHFLDWQCAAFGIGPDDRVAFLTSVGFDVVLRNVFLPLHVGACLVVPPPLNQFDDVIGWLAERRITVLHLTPSMSENWIEASPAAPVTSSLRRTFFSGEVLLGSTVQRWRSAVGSEQVINLYGPTETCMIRVAYTIPETVGAGPLPAGVPMPGTTITLDHSAPGADAQWGEVILHTLHGTLGYIGEPERWLAVASPGAHPAEWTYRTGDLGRFDDAGALVIGGRCNDEVKVNGHRVDPADVAARLRQMEGVSTATAFTVAGAEDTRELVTAVVPSSPGLTVRSVRERLADVLPNTLVPRWVTVLDALPLTPNGKVDRAAILRRAQREADTANLGPVDPSVLAFVLGLWRHVFPHREITPSSNFYELGGNSMQVIRLLHELRSRYQVRLSLRSLYLADTPALVAHEVQRALEQRAAPAGNEAPPANQNHTDVAHTEGRSQITGDTLRLPARRAQRLFLDLFELDASLGSSVLIVARTVTGPLDLGALDRALNRLVERHDALRSWFDLARREQVVAASAVLVFERVEAIGADDRAIDALLRARVAPDLGAWPLVRPVLVHHAADCWVVALVAQHAIVDSRSQDILIDDLRRLYEAEVTGVHAQLAALPCGSPEVEQHERALTTNGVFDADLAFWRERLSQRRLTLALPTDRPRTAGLLVDGAEVRTRVPAQLRSALESLAAERGGTLFRVLAGLWSAFLAGVTGDEDLVLTTPAMTREVEGAASMCGMYVMRIPLVLTARPDQTVFEVVAGAVSEVSLAGRHRHAHIGDLVRRGEAADPARTQPLHVAVNLLGWRERSPLTDGLDTRWDWYPDGAERPLLEFELRALASEGTQLTFLLRYDANVHDAESMATMVNDFVAFCEAAVSDVHQPISLLPLHAARPPQSVHALMAQRVTDDPARAAVVEHATVVSRESLEHRVHDLAGALVAADVVAGSLVGIALDRTVDCVAAVLAAHRVGAAFVLLPAGGYGRATAQLMEALSPSVLLAAQTPSFATGRTRVLRVDRPGVAFPCRVAERSAASDQAAYVVIDGGESTEVQGRVVQRSALDACLDAAEEEYGLTEDDVVVHLRSALFGAGLDGVFVAARTGGRLVVVEDTWPANGPEELLAEAERQGASVLSLLQSVLEMLLDSAAVGGRAFPAAVRQVIIAGPGLDDEVARRLREWAGAGLRVVHAVHPVTDGAVVVRPDVSPPQGHSDEVLVRCEPAGPSQERFWVLRQLDERDLYQMQCTWSIVPSIAEADIAAAVDHVVQQHEVLRTRFEYRAGEGLVQCIDPAGTPWWRAVDEDDEAALLAAMTAPFDLSREWPVRFGLVRRAGGGAHLHLLAHHVAGDAASLPALTAALREGCRDGDRRGVLPAQYAERVRAERAYLRGEGGWLERDESFWRDRLAGARWGRRSSDGVGAAATGRAVRSRLAVGTPLPGLVQQAAVSMRTTPASLYIAAAAVVAARLAAADSVVIGVPVSLRSRATDASVVGPFINTLPLRLKVDTQQPFGHLVAHVSEVLAECLDHRELPFERIARLADDSGGGVPQLEWVVNVLDGGALGVESAGDIQLILPDRVPVGARFDVTLTVLLGERTVLTADVRDSVDDLTADGLVAAVTGVLAQALEDSTRPVSDIPMLDAERRSALDGERASTARPLPAQTLDVLLAEVIAQHAHRPALVDGDRTWTYADLDREVAAIAQRLAGAGVGMGSAVGLALDRSVALVASIVAVTRLGAVYVPVDTAQPAQRTEQMLDAAGARVVVHHDGDSVAITHRPDAADPVWPAGADDDPASRPLYAMFTSGSTGTPKGVVVPHRAVVRLVRNTDYLNLTADDVVALSANPAFDASTWEVWGALLSGACLVVVDAEVLASPMDFAALVRQRRVTAAFVTTALLHVFAALQPNTLASIRTVLFGGERCDPSAVRAVLGERESGRLVHVYGPTECTTFALWHEVHPADTEQPRVPIGRAIANTQCWVLDAAGHEAPPGVTGELYLGGDGLALGYLGDEALTRERFVVLHTSAGPVRTYRTGDLVRARHDGALDFIGRVDRQVKIRGFRVQPEEVEAAMLSHQAVSAAIVLVERDHDGARLVGVAQSPDLSPVELRRFLARQLPAAMVPAELVVLPAIPLNANGKLDRRTLADAVAAAGASTQTAPPTQGPVGFTGETALVTHARVLVESLWSSALGLDPTVPADREVSFFDLGGNSLLVVRLLADVQRATGANLSLSSVLAHPTLASLIDAVARDLSDRSALSERGNLLDLRPGTDPPLCLVHPAGGHLLPYARLVPRLTTSRRLIGAVARGVDRRGWLHWSFDAMGRSYGRALASVDGVDGLVVLGFSSGALIAAETVRHLQSAGVRVGALVLIDPAGDATPPADEEAAVVVTPVEPTATSGTPRRRVGLRRRVRNSARYRWSLLKPRLVPLRLLFLPFRSSRSDRSALSLEQHRRLSSRYRPQPFAQPVRTLLVLASMSPNAERVTRVSQRWTGVVGAQLEVVELEGTHVGPDGILADRRVAVAAAEIDRFLGSVGP